MKSTFKKNWLAIVIGIIAIVFVVYKVVVLNIVWAGISADEADAWKETVLPPNAVQVIEAESQSEVLTQSYFLIVPLIVVPTTFILIGKKKRWFITSKKGIMLGVTASFLLQGLHELLHGIAFPAGSIVYIGIIKANFSGYAMSMSPINMIQCVIYYLLPAFVMGIVPLMAFLLDKEKKSVFCWFCYGFALIGLIQTSPDWFALFPILRQVPNEAIIQTSGWHTYWYLQ